jgi:hypothetical protein
VRSRVTENFISLFQKLPADIKALARKKYRLWKQNPSHPGLRFKRIHSRETLYSIRISQGWRAVGLLEEDTVTWFWIGSHAEYDNLIG